MSRSLDHVIASVPSSATVPKGARMVDATSLQVIPGLTDNRAHPVLIGMSSARSKLLRSSVDGIVKMMVFLTAMRFLAAMASVRARYMGQHRPASTAVQVVDRTRDPARNRSRGGRAMRILHREHSNTLLRTEILTVQPRDCPHPCGFRSPFSEADGVISVAAEHACGVVTEFAELAPT